MKQILKINKYIIISSLLFVLFQLISLLSLFVFIQDNTFLNLDYLIYLILNLIIPIFLGSFLIFFTFWQIVFLVLPNKEVMQKNKLRILLIIINLISFALLFLGFMFMNLNESRQEIIIFIICKSLLPLPSFFISLLLFIKESNIKIAKFKLLSLSNGKEKNN